MKKFILFNTLKKAQHYVKHCNKNYLKEIWDDGEQFLHYEISKDKVLRVWGWRCGCGCDRGSTDATVIARIKNPLNK